MITVEHARRPVPSAANGAARRHRVEGGRRHAVKIRFTDAEYDAIAVRATQARVSVQRFMVGCALTRRPLTAAAPSALTAELTALRRLVANLANNINQIARKLNSGGVPDSSIPAIADAVQRALRRLDAVLSGLDISPPGPAPPRTAQDPDLLPPAPDRSGTPRITAPPGRTASGTPG